MSVKTSYITLIICFLSCFANAQDVPVYTSKSLAENTLTITSDSGRLSITACKPNVIEVQFFAQLDSTVTINKKVSEKLNIRVTQNLDDVFFATDSLWVIVSKYDLSIRFLKKQREQFMVKNNSYFLANQTEEISFSLHTDDKPILADAKKSKLKQMQIISKKRLYNPMLISSKGYALLLENPTNKRVEVSFTSGKQVVFKGKDKAIQSFYFLSGGHQDIRRLVAGFNKCK